LAKTKTIENLFNDLASYSHFLPILIFLFYFRKSSRTRALWFVVIYDLYNFLTDLGLLYLTHRPTRVFLYSSFTFFEYILFASVLYLVIKNASFKKFILLISICFTLFIVLYNLYVKVRGIDSIPIGVETILVLIFSFYYLYEQMKDTETLFVYSRYSFWIVLAVMLYLAGSFFIYIYASQLPDEEVGKYWIFTNIFSILKNVFFTISILINVKQTNSAKKKAFDYKFYPLN
jgi:hypothetical protein